MTDAAMRLPPLATVPFSSTPTERIAASIRRSGVPLLIRFTAFSMFFFPSSMVIKPLGAAGTVPMILSCILLLFWVASSLWGLHDPIPLRHPGRIAVAAFALTTMASYVWLYGGWVPQTSVEGLAAADRWLILVAASLGLVLSVGDSLRSEEDLLSIVRWALAGGFFSSVVGVIQFVFLINPMEWIQAAMPGFTYNGGDVPFQARGNLVRVAGSTFHSIEFATTSAMLLPLSIWRAIYDRRGWRWFHWLQTALLVFAVASTVTRSGMLGVAVALLIATPFLPRLARRWVLTLVPLAVIALFSIVPGFIGTITSALTADSSDPSIATRLNNYPRAEMLIDAQPWLGLGPGNYTHQTLLQVFDNQYLGSAVATGIIGFFGIVIYFWLPAVTTIAAARRAPTVRLRSLAGALAGGMAAAGACSIAFDSLSFPVFALLYPLLIGISGGVWRLSPRKSDPPAAAVQEGV
jgi:O-antigen ligase